MTETPQPNPFTEVNPYTPSPTAILAGQRPGGLTAICIIAIVLGLLGSLSGIVKGANAAFGAQMQQAFGSIGAGAGNGDMQKAQQEMNNALAAEMLRFRLVNGVLCVAQLALCIALVYSGVKTLGLNVSGRRLLLWICCLLLFYEACQLAVFVYQQLSIAPIMELYMPRMMKGPNGEDIGGENFGKIIARMSIIVGMISQCIWTVIKFGFYGFAIYYLRKAKVVELFSAKPESENTSPDSPPSSDNLAPSVT